MSNQILPNTRFGTTFLDKKYKKYAELGEVVIDKITGELLLKRKIDGKLVSFVQNDKYFHDIMVELRILLKNYTSFTYPSEDDSWFVSSDFNVVDMIGGNPKDVLHGDSLTFATSALDEKMRLRFHLSKACNGFFIRPISRDTDKNFIEYMTNLYNQIFQYYNGLNTSFTAEKSYFADETFYDSNALITYNVTVTGLQGEKTVTNEFSDTEYIKINEEVYVALPSNYNSAFDSIESIVVEISDISFPKFSKILEYMETDTSFDTTVYDALISPDKVINIEHVNVMIFVDSAEDIPVNNNIVNPALFGTKFVLEYCGRVDKLAGSAGVIPSGMRPSSDIWTVNNAWAELIRTVKAGAQTSPIEHETDIDALEKYIYNTSGIVTNFSFNETDEDDIYINDITSSK